MNIEEVEEPETTQIYKQNPLPSVAATPKLRKFTDETNMQARNHENSDEFRPTPVRHLDLATPAFYYYRKNPKCYHTVWGNVDAEKALCYWRFCVMPCTDLQLALEFGLLPHLGYPNRNHREPHQKSMLVVFPQHHREEGHRCPQSQQRLPMLALFLQHHRHKGHRCPQSQRLRDGSTGHFSKNHDLQLLQGLDGVNRPGDTPSS